MTQRSTTADKYRKLYSTKQWRTLRGTTLTRDHYRCQRCSISLTSGKSEPTSAVVHHEKPHKGNLTVFYDPSNLAGSLLEPPLRCDTVGRIVGLRHHYRGRRLACGCQPSNHELALSTIRRQFVNRMQHTHFGGYFSDKPHVCR